MNARCRRLNPGCANADDRLMPARATDRSGDATRIIRPAAVLDERAAFQVLEQLRRLDVEAGGVWNATSVLWQRYDRAWDGIGGTRGSATLVGSIAVMYDSPHRHEITIYKATVTEAGLAAGWAVERLCDDALIWARLTLATCPRAELADPPVVDPFRQPGRG